MYIKGFDYTRKNIGYQLSWFYDDNGDFVNATAASTGSHYNTENSTNFYLAKDNGAVCISIDHYFSLFNLEITAFCDGSICDASWFSDWSIDEEVIKDKEVPCINRFGTVEAHSIYSKTDLNGSNSVISNNLNVGGTAIVGGITTYGIGTFNGAVTFSNTTTLGLSTLRNGIANNKVLSTDGNGLLTLVNHNAYWQKHSITGSNPNTIGYSGTVYIGANPTTTVPISETNYKLVVAGTIGTQKVKVTQQGWADYVFAKDYKLQPLTEIERFIKTNKHLPEIPSEKEVKENGVDIGETQMLLLKKIEELTLHLIEQEKQNKIQNAQIKEQHKEILKLKKKLKI